MALFFPSVEPDHFPSKGELFLYRLLSALDDNFVVIHSCPWLGSSTRRVYSEELSKHIDLYATDRKHLSGEIDFVLAHPQYGILCVEVKAGEYRPEGYQFVHKHKGFTANPLYQVRDNAFTILRLLKKEEIKCPVGYAIYFSDSELDTSNLHPAYMPLGSQDLEDGILILPRHEHEIARRVEALFAFWRKAQSYDLSLTPDFSEQVARFIKLIWPQELHDNSVGRKITFDGNLWLKLDKCQLQVVQDCLKNEVRLVAGFAGTGKTIIASTIAIAKAKAGKRILLLFKNRKICEHVNHEMMTTPYHERIDVYTFHAFCENIRATKSTKSGLITTGSNYSTYHEYLLNLLNDRYDCLIVDEAQGLSESEHRALHAYFRNSTKYIFADRHQVFPGLEPGVEYDFLENLYGSKFYHLTSVYRNPLRVTEAIQGMVETEHQIFNHRHDDAEALEILFTRDVEKEINEKIVSLVNQGCKREDIVVLSQFAKEVSIDKAPLFSIAAYRGMESPVVLVYAGRTIDDISLACALARCTTRAILFFDLRSIYGSADSIKSSFLREKFVERRLEIFEKDKGPGNPFFIENQ